MAENNMFELKIISPEEMFYEGEASFLEFTSVGGDMGVYKNHIPLTTVLAPGIVTITQEDGQKKAAVHSGFAQILGDKVTLLAEIAEWPDEIDWDRAEAARRRAEERLAAKTENLDMARAELALRRALVRISLR